MRIFLLCLLFSVSVCAQPDPDELLLAARACALSYAYAYKHIPEEEKKRWTQHTLLFNATQTKQPKGALVKKICARRRGDIDAVMVSYPGSDIHYISFPGRKTWEDTFTMMDIRRAPLTSIGYSDILGHSGLFHRYEKIRDALQKVCASSKKLCFTGHSLGATTAAFAFLDYLLKTHQNVSLIQFAPVFPALSISIESVLEKKCCSMHLSSTFWLKDDMFLSVPHLLSWFGFASNEHCTMWQGPPAKGVGTHRLKRHISALEETQTEDELQGKAASLAIKRPASIS